MKGSTHMSKHDFRWDRFDFLMAVSCFILGFLYIRIVFFGQQGLGVTLFALFFIGAVLAYARFKNVKASNESWFWAGVLLVIAASFALWQGNSVSGLRPLLLLVSAIYWVLILTRTTQSGTTSDFLPVDILRGMLILPISHLHIQYNCLRSFLKGRVKLRSNVFYAVLGAFIAFIFIIVAWPFLIAADTGGFQDLLRELNIYPSYLPFIDNQLVVQIILMFPTAAYMFALLAQGVHTGVEADREGSTNRFPEKLRVIPAVTVYTALIILNIFYVVFFITQAPYYVAAFRGVIPEGWESYAEFARRGFFELVAISVLNSIFVAFSHLFITGTGKNAGHFKFLIIILSLCSVFLTVTAAARLILYVDRFGLTIMRVLPSVFMVFLTIVFIGVMVKQFKRISVMRLAAFTGALLICLLFIVNIEGIVPEYNADRYLEGTLEEFDTSVLWDAGVAGIPAAIRVFKESDDPLLRSEIRYNHLKWTDIALRETDGTIKDTLQHMRARRMIEEHRELLGLAAE